jgi:hypothetical protein
MSRELGAFWINSYGKQSGSHLIMQSKGWRHCGMLP